MAFRWRQALRFGDVDSAGIVYYPRYFHYCHVAMEEYFRQVLGVSYPELIAGQRFGYPAVSITAELPRPLRYGDTLDIEVVPEKLGTSSITWCFRFFKLGEGEPAASVRIVTVGLDLEKFEKRPIPAWLRDQASRGSDNEPPTHG